MALATIPLAAISVATGPLEAQVASASVIVPLVKCGSMESEGSVLTVPAELSNCNRPRLTGGSGSNIQVGPGPYPINWATGKEIAFNCGGNPTPDCGGPPSSFPVSGRCPAGLTEFDFVGTVATTLGPWTKRYVGDPLLFDVCLTSGFGVAELVPGTDFMILKP